MEIVPLGDSALIVRVRERFEDAPEETLDEVLRAFQRIRNAAIPGVIELAPAYTSVAVFLDPVGVAKANGTPDGLFDWLGTKISNAARSALLRDGAHDPEFAPDLDHVAEHAKILPTEVVDLHRSGEYRAACIWFVPGFPFLTGL